jgi:hypothetical protein
MNPRYLSAPLISAALVLLMSITSAASGTEAPGLLPPVNVSPPIVFGTAQVESSLIADAGSWTGPAETVASQWQRCDANGEACVDVAGATSTSYLLEVADVLSTMRIVVTATNKNGSTLATSAPSGLIAAAPDPAPAVVPPSPVTSPTIAGTGSKPGLVEWHRAVRLRIRLATVRFRRDELRECRRKRSDIHIDRGRCRRDDSRNGDGVEFGWLRNCKLSDHQRRHVASCASDRGARVFENQLE